MSSSALNAQKCVESKPKTVERLINSVVLNWPNFENNTTDFFYQVQILNSIKNWVTIKWILNLRSFVILNLEPCTAYELRIKRLDEKNWINFKTATSDETIFTSQHITRALEFSKIGLLRKIVQKSPYLLEVENKHNKTPLMQSIDQKKLNLVHYLINLGANPNTSQQFTQKTPLMFAIYNNSLEIAQFLIDKGAIVQNTDINGLNILHYATDSNKIENVNFVLDLKKININSTDRHNFTPLIRAAILSTNPKIIKLLLKNGANPNAVDKMGFNFEFHQKLNRK